MRKDLSLQSLRGLAVILMVSGHVIGARAEWGMRVGDTSLWRYAYLGFEDIRMPLFTVISGLVYAMRPVRNGAEYRGLLRAKTRRLVLPMVTVGTLLFAVEMATPDTTSHTPPLADLWRVYALGFEHLWFLQAIFLAFLVTAVLDLFVAVRIPDELELFSMNGAIRLLPFFLLGYGLHHLRELSCALLVGSVLVFAVFFTMRVVLMVTLWQPEALTQRLVSLGVGVPAIGLLYAARRLVHTRLLAWIGGFSFGVYLLHGFVLTVCWAVLDAAGVESQAVSFGVCLVLAVLAPIGFQVQLGQWNPVRVGIFGEKPLPRTALVRSETAPLPAEHHSTDHYSLQSKRNPV